MTGDRESLTAARCRAAGGEGCGCSYEPYDCGAFTVKRWLCEEEQTNVLADFVRALDLHKQRIRLLQEELCECPHREFFQADLHDGTCPVYVVAQAQKASV